MANGSGLIPRFCEEVIGGGQINLVDELTTDDLVDHEEGLPGQPPGREGVKFFITAMREAFPDIRVGTVEPTMVDGNLEAARVTLTGTHKGELMGVAATNGCSSSALCPSNSSKPYIALEAAPAAE